MTRSAIVVLGALSASVLVACGDRNVATISQGHISSAHEKDVKQAEKLLSEMSHFLDKNVEELHDIVANRYDAKMAADITWDAPTLSLQALEQAALLRFSLDNPEPFPRIVIRYSQENFKHFSEMLRDSLRREGFQVVTLNCSAHAFKRTVTYHIEDPKILISYKAANDIAEFAERLHIFCTNNFKQVVSRKELFRSGNLTPLHVVLLEVGNPLGD